MDTASTNQVQEHSHNEPIGASETHRNKSQQPEAQGKGFRETNRIKKRAACWIGEKQKNEWKRWRMGTRICGQAMPFWRLEQQRTNMPNQPSARGKQKCDEVTQKQWQSEESDCLSSLRVSRNTGSVNLVVVDGTPYRPRLLCPPVFLALCGRIAAHMPGCQQKEVTKTTLWQRPWGQSACVGHSVFLF